LIPTGVFVLLLTGALFFDFVLGMDVPFEAVYVNFMIQGSVWALIGIIFWAVSARGDGRLKQIKYDGEEYDGSIEEFHPVYGVRILHYLTLRADCSYMNHEQKKCLVRSRAFLYTNALGMMNRNRNSTHGLTGEDFFVKVYVNRNNPRDYAVEIFERNGKEIFADYDYR
jgi:hypothetical protein